MIEKLIIVNIDNLLDVNLAKAYNVWLHEYQNQDYVNGSLNSCSFIKFARFPSYP